MEQKKKVVVAFSGGLDTSFTVMYLAKEKGYEVYGLIRRSSISDMKCTLHAPIQAVSAKNN